MQLKIDVDHFHLPGGRGALKICFESETFAVKNGYDYDHL